MTQRRPLTRFAHVVLVPLAVVIALAPSLTARAEFTDEDYAAHIEKLKDRLPSDDFTIIIEKPFVVIGDEADWVVKKRGRDTVRWSVTKLKAEYFSKDPDVILDVWLFKDKQSYEANVKAVFGDTPTTPFGYYSRKHKALIMNIQTGGGTLVHEIVHPFVEANFPQCPAWFNEGLGSLYEQCRDHNGRIWGLPNWRLAGLQKAIRTESVPTFAELCATTTGQFYYRDRGTNYAQARYLCLYLQEKGLLKKFYEQFVANHKDDPTGFKTLQAVLGEDDMQAFQTKWEQWVMGLRFQ